VKVNLSGHIITVEGPKGKLSLNFHPEISVKIEDSQISINRSSDSRFHRSLHGLTRSLIFNMVEGVTKGYSKTLEIIGVGYSAELRGKVLVLNLGFSHSIVFHPPEQIRIEVPSNTKIIISGSDKQLVGQVAAKIRSFRPPEPYKGKGIRYSGEHVHRKAGKAGGK
jgi:large subunit ribosomal protein L6